MGQAIAGVFIGAMGIFLGWLFWWLATREGMFAPVGPFFAAGMVLLGFGLVAFGGFREERLRRGESLEGLTGLRLLTPRWWGLLLLWLALGALYAVALRRG
jgi:hypothetical protein